MSETLFHYTQGYRAVMILRDGVIRRSSGKTPPYVWRFGQEPRQTRPRADGGGVGPCYAVRDAALAIPSNAVER